MLRQIGSANRLLALGLAVSAGCRLGVPMERNVQISQQLGIDRSNEPVPKTRLAPAGSVGDTTIGQTTSVAHRPAVADSPSYSLSDQTDGQTADPPVQIQFSDVGEGALENLIAEFRTSPPEVQQRMLEQLATAIRQAEGVSRTAQPVDITGHLVRSLDSLPDLPDDEELPEGASTPIRLAAASSETLDKPDTEAIRQAIGSTDPVASGNLGVTLSLSDLGGDPMAANPSAPLTESPTKSSPSVRTAASTRELYGELLARLAEPVEGESAGERLARELTRRHLQVLAGDSEWSVEAFAGMSLAERAFLRNHLAAVGKLVDPSGHPVASRRFAMALPEYREGTRQLGYSAEHLEVRSAVFCKDFNGFGQVERFEDSRFQAGQKVFLYCEVDNFVAESVEAGFETELQGSYEIFDAAGNKVSGQVLPTDRQRCDQPIRDYCVAYEMQLPSRLEPGEYYLELTMECVRGEKFGQARLPLTIRP